MPREGWNPALLRRIISEYPQPYTASRALREYRSMGGHARTQTWYRLWGEVQNERSLAGIEEGADLRYRPQAHEILPMTVPRASGYLQRVTVFARTRSEQVIAKTIDIKVRQPKSRAWAIREAEAIAQKIRETGEGNPDTELTTVLGGVYGGTYELRKP